MSIRKHLIRMALGLAYLSALMLVGLITVFLLEFLPWVVFVAAAVLVIYGVGLIAQDFLEVL